MPVKLTSAVYNPTLNAVTLTIKGKLPTQPLQLSINASAIVDTQGQPLQGNNNGQPGGTFQAAFGKAGITLASVSAAGAGTAEPNREEKRDILISTIQGASQGQAWVVVFFRGFLTVASGTEDVDVRGGRPVVAAFTRCMMASRSSVSQGISSDAPRDGASGWGRCRLATDRVLRPAGEAKLRYDGGRARQPPVLPDRGSWRRVNVDPSRP